MDYVDDDDDDDVYHDDDDGAKTVGTLLLCVLQILWCLFFTFEPDNWYVNETG